MERIPPIRARERLIELIRKESFASGWWNRHLIVSGQSLNENRILRIAARRLRRLRREEIGKAGYVLCFGWPEVLARQVFILEYYRLARELGELIDDYVWEVQMPSGISLPMHGERMTYLEPLVVAPRAIAAGRHGGYASADVVLWAPRLLFCERAARTFEEKFEPKDPGDEWTAEQLEDCQKDFALMEANFHMERAELSFLLGDWARTREFAEKGRGKLRDLRKASGRLMFPGLRSPTVRRYLSLWESWVDLKEGRIAASDEKMWEILDTIEQLLEQLFKRRDSHSFGSAEVMLRVYSSWFKLEFGINWPKREEFLQYFPHYCYPYEPAARCLSAEQRAAVERWHKRVMQMADSIPDSFFEDNIFLHKNRKKESDAEK